MTAVTTRGHCGTIPMGMGIKGGRIYSTGGSFAFYPIRLGGRVSGSGSVSLKAVAGPRIAHGTGSSTGCRAAESGPAPGPPAAARATGAPSATDGNAAAAADFHIARRRQRASERSDSGVEIVRGDPVTSRPPRSDFTSFGGCVRWFRVGSGGESFSNSQFAHAVNSFEMRPGGGPDIISCQLQT